MSVPHSARTQTWTRGSEQVYSAFPSLDCPPPYCTAGLEHCFDAKSLHQVLVKENLNVLRGEKKLQTTSSASGAAPPGSTAIS